MIIQDDYASEHNLTQPMRLSTAYLNPIGTKWNIPRPNGNARRTT